jgi:aryl-alcohol dehydrogenase-like predicted oxidoreductase
MQPQDLPEDFRLSKATREGWSERWDAYNNERTWSVIEVLGAVAQELGKSPAQVALNWVKDQPGITAPITGARNLTQLNDNLGSVGWVLSAEHRALLSECSHTEGPYPYNFIANATQRR